MNRQDIKDWLRVMLIVAGLCFIIGLCIYWRAGSIRKDGGGMKVLSESGKIIGHIEEGVFTKRVKGSLHMLRMPPAWAIDETTFHHQVSPHAHTIRIEDTEADTAYEVDALIFAEQSTLLKRRHGNQLFLPLCRWAMKNKSQGALI